MTEPLTRQRISDVVDPLGWRLILGVAVTHVPVPSLAAAAEAAAVAISTDGVDGHLTVDLHDDRLVLRVHTIDAGFVTEPDLDLIARVTAALAARGLATQQAVDDVAPQTFEIAVDAMDIPLLRPFW